MKFIRLHISLVLLLSSVIFSACAPQPLDCSKADVFCVGLVTAYDGIENHGLNQTAWEALQQTVSAAHVARLDYIESVDTRDWEKNVTFFADNGYDVIVTVGTNLTETTNKVAAQYPSISFIGIDQELEQSSDHIATINFAEDKAGFLAGMLAAMVSSSRKVGAVCETSGIDEVWQYCEGFRAGATYEADGIEVTVLYRENGDRDKTFNDPDWGKEKTLALADKGVDVMTAFGGNTAQGAFLEAPETGISVIGSEEDLYGRLPDVQDVLVTSIINDPGSALSALVLTASQGRLVSGAHAGQIRYAPFRTNEFPVGEIQPRMNEAIQEIEAGAIEINLPEKK